VDSYVAGNEQLDYENGREEVMGLGGWRKGKWGRRGGEREAVIRVLVLFVLLCSRLHVFS